MSVLLTGSSGFIGSNFVFSSSLKLRQVVRNNKHIKNQDYFIINNLDSKTCWDGAFLGIKCVIHLAGLAHSNLFTKKDYQSINVEGTLNFASEAAKAGVKRFIFISSILACDVENQDTKNEVSLQAKSKYDTEIFLKKMAAETGMEVVIIRPPLVYGPGVKANFYAMLKLASTGIPLPFGCMNDNKRSMVYVENLISLIVECIDNPNAANHTFLISDDNDLSTKEFVKGLSVGLGKSGLMFPVPSVLFSIVGKVLGKSAVIDTLCGSLQVDINHTKDTLNWQPPYSVELGFAATVKHFKEQQVK
jgi:UDP-glucose 4-epimerase